VDGYGGIRVEDGKLVMQLSRPSKEGKPDKTVRLVSPQKPPQPRPASRGPRGTKPPIALQTIHHTQTNSATPKQNPSSGGHRTQRIPTVIA
jgi:hypothetical protein